MKRMTILGLSLFLLLSCFFHWNFDFAVVKALDARPVHNVSTGLNYSSIQGAIDALETVGGNTILVDGGIYSTTLTVDKSVAIIGAGRNATVVDGGGGIVVVHIVADDVLIEGLEVTNGQVGIYIDHSDNGVLRENGVTNVTGYGGAGYAIWAVYSNNLTVDQNVVGANSVSGILISNSLGFRVSNNEVYNNGGYGINANASISGLISQNDVYGNSYDGIGLSQGSRDINVTRNNIKNNVFGVDVIDPDCVGNIIYDNNITGNGKQASVFSANRWDNGFEGNYWSDYAGVDLNNDGIGDTPQVLSENNTDNYPLMGAFSFFDAALGFDVDVVSNSSIASFAYFLWNGTAAMHVKSTSSAQTYGFCRVRVPHGLMDEPYNVTVGGANPLYSNYTLYDNGNSRWIYFLYQQSDREVLIRARTPPATVSIVSPANKTYTESDVPLTFTIDEETSWLTYSLDGQTNVTITGNSTLPNVSNGTHTVVLYAQNSFGDMSASGVVYFTVSVSGFGLFPFLVAAAVAVVVVLAAVFVYLREFRRKRGKNA